MKLHGFEVNKENLEILAAGLLGEIKPTIDPGSTVFDMSHYTIPEDKDEDHIDDPSLTECQSAGCAIGWAPFFGIEKMEGEFWHDYAARQFFNTVNDGVMIDDTPAFTWMFGFGWKAGDNSKEGAGLRIRHFLKHGVPSNYRFQMNGKHPLIYR